MASSANSKVGGNENRDKNPERYAICVACVISVGFAAFLMVLFKTVLNLQDNPLPPLPIFSVSSFTETFINASSSYQIALNFTVSKPKSDSTKTTSYDDIVASLYYDNNVIGTTTLFPFEPEEARNSVAVIKVKFMLDPKFDVGAMGVFTVRVSAITVLSDDRYEMRRKLDAFCEDIRVESGSMVGPIKGCRVEGSLI